MVAGNPEVSGLCAELASRVVKLKEEQATGPRDCAVEDAAKSRPESATTTASAVSTREMIERGNNIIIYTPQKLIFGQLLHEIGMNLRRSRKEVGRPVADSTPRS